MSGPLATVTYNLIKNVLCEYMCSLNMFLVYCSRLCAQVFLDILDTAHSSPKLSKARTTGTRQHIHIYICKQIHIKQPLTPKQIYADYTNIYMYVLTTRLA